MFNVRVYFFIEHFDFGCSNHVCNFVSKALVYLVCFCDYPIMFILLYLPVKFVFVSIHVVHYLTYFVSQPRCWWSGDSKSFKRSVVVYHSGKFSFKNVCFVTGCTGCIYFSPSRSFKVFSKLIFVKILKISSSNYFWFIFRFL